MAHPQRKEMSLLVERQLHLGHGIARMGVVEERLRAGRHPVHGTLGDFRADQLGDVFGIGAGLLPERAADVLGDNPQALLRHVDDAHDVVAHGAGALRADAQGVAVVRRMVGGGGAARFHGGVREPLVGHRDTGDMVRRCDNALDLARIRLGIGMRAGPVDGDVTRRFRPQLRRVRLHRLAHADDRVDRLVVDGHELGGVLRRVCRFRNHHRDGLAHVHCALARKRGAMRHHELLAAATDERRMARHAAEAGRLHVGTGDDREHAFDLARRLDVDAADAGMGMRRAHKGRSGLTGFRRIGDKAAGAAHEGVVLDPRFVGVLGVGLGIHAIVPVGRDFSRAAVIAQSAGQGRSFGPVRNLQQRSGKTVRPGTTWIR